MLNKSVPPVGLCFIDREVVVDHFSLFLYLRQFQDMLHSIKHSSNNIIVTSAQQMYNVNKKTAPFYSFIITEKNLITMSVRAQC